ncbi:transcription termination factor 3, mitochondrial-like isoform X2 [Paramacrobiotus metropolitanus]|uniref:transcription termination factor 3, mitochondrial-like isoform X2 n=1 Tax=Paramacrobiotus metropolitanus TaxID=2943436 RepID=UPI002445C686|nr:transcription termination factor 3, mitochondrial-like isoform X2 [Paramacrobiotus metropolitanus]
MTMHSINTHNFHKVLCKSWWEVANTSEKIQISTTILNSSTVLFCISLDLVLLPVISKNFTVGNRSSTMIRSIQRLHPHFQWLYLSSPVCMRCAAPVSAPSASRNLHELRIIRLRSTVAPQDQPGESSEVSSQSPTKSQSSDAQYFRQLIQQSSKQPAKVDWTQFVNPDLYKKGELNVNDQPEVHAKFGLLHRTTSQQQSADDAAEEVPNVLQRTATIGLAERKTRQERSSHDASVEILDAIPRTSTGLADDLDNVDWAELEKQDPERRPLEPVDDQDSLLADAVPTAPPYAFNLAAYAEKSPNIRKFLDLGVEVYQYDQDPEMSQLLATGDWDTRIQPVLDFLQSLGIKEKNQARILSKWPRILKHDIAQLNEKVEYLRSKKFPPEAVARILVKAPLLFSLSVRHVDKQLGALQRTFKLTGDEVRDVVTAVPKIVTMRSIVWAVIRLAMMHEMGFRKEEIKAMLLMQPKIFLLDKKDFLRRFDYLHNVVGIQHADIAAFPGAMRTRVFEVKDRHLFLKKLGRDQYDRTQPNYVSLHDLCSGSNWDFCMRVAKQPLRYFNAFRKTL